MVLEVTENAINLNMVGTKMVKDIIFLIRRVVVRANQRNFYRNEYFKHGEEKENISLFPPIATHAYNCNLITSFSHGYALLVSVLWTWLVKVRMGSIQ